LQYGGPVARTVEYAMIITAKKAKKVYDLEIVEQYIKMQKKMQIKYLSTEQIGCFFRGEKAGYIYFNIDFK